MKIVKLSYGNVYVYNNVFFNRNEEIEVSDELAEELLALDVKDYDPDMRTISSFKYFSEVAPAAKPKKATKDKGADKSDEDAAAQANVTE